MRKVHLLQRDFTELTGTVHNHTQYSFDCDVSVKKILSTARKHLLDYVTLNDHNCIVPEDKLKAALNSLSDTKGSLPIVIRGSELNDPEDNNHLLVFNGVVPEDNLPIAETIALQKQTKAVLFAAHPYETRADKQFPLYIWNDYKQLSNLHGMEIWNYASSWLSKLNPSKNGVFLVLFPNLFIRKPFTENLKLWDEQNLSGNRLAAIGSTDSHGTKHRLLFFNIRILTHNQLFKTIRTNVLINEGEKIDEKSILTALANGNSYIANYRMGYPYNFYAGISKENNAGVTFGEEIDYKDGLKLYYRLPKHSRIELLRNGTKVAEQNEKCGWFPIEETGNYRLEITRYGFGWIYTNNIYVR